MKTKLEKSYEDQPYSIKGAFDLFISNCNSLELEVVDTFTTSISLSRRFVPEGYFSLSIRQSDLEPKNEDTEIEMVGVSIQLKSDVLFDRVEQWLNKINHKLIGQLPSELTVISISMLPQAIRNTINKNIKRTPTEAFEQKVQSIPNEVLINNLHTKVAELCSSGGKSFVLSIPPRPDDIDIMFDELVRRYEALTQKEVENEE